MTETATATAPGRAIALVIEGTRYELNEGNLRPTDVMALRKATGYSLNKLFQLLSEDPDIDLLAAVLWLARRSNGEATLTFEEVANSFNYDSDIEYVRPGDQATEPADADPEA